MLVSYIMMEQGSGASGPGAVCGTHSHCFCFFFFWQLPPELSMASDARWNGHAQLPGYSAEKENSLLLPGAQNSSSQPQSQQYRQHSKGRG